MNVAEIVAAAQNGDNKAIEELYHCYIKEIKTIAQCYFPNEYDAEDAASEIFLTLIRKIGTIKNPASFHSWLHKVAVNRCYSILQKKHELLPEEEDYIEQECNTCTGNFSEFVPHENLDNIETQKMILQIVAGLSEKHKSVILMHYYSDMSVESIAKVLNISVGTVKSRLSCARDKIKKKIKVYEKQGIKLYNIDVLKSLGQIISNLSQNTTVTTNFQTVINSLAGSSGTLTSVVSTVTATQVSNIVSTSVAHTISNSTATRVSVITSAVVIATCTAVTQLPPTDAQVTPPEPEIQVSKVLEVEHDISIVEKPVIQESIVYVPSEVVNTVYDTSIIHDISTVYDTSTIYNTSTIYDISTVHDTSVIETTKIETSTVYEPSIIYIENEPSIVYVEKIVEVPKPNKDYSQAYYKEDKFFKYKIYPNANEAEIVQLYSVPSDSYEILQLPDTVDGIPITKIGRNAFSRASFHGTIKIGENVEKIDRGAFSYCNLKTIELNDKITEIAPRTFYHTPLKTVTGGKNVEVIGEEAFVETEMKAINFSTALKSIEYNAFGDIQPEEILFPESMEYINTETNHLYASKMATVYINTEQMEEKRELYQEIYAEILYHVPTVNIIFTGDSMKFSELAFNVIDLLHWQLNNNQTLNIAFDDSIMEIDNNAFYNFYSLQEITLPKNLKSLGNYSFGYCESLEKITFNESLQSIGNSAFCGCISLTNITIPDSVTKIGENAFENCFGLESITLPDSLETIGDLAFINCKSLKAITIPENVTYIGENAFDDTCTIYGTPGSYAQQFAEETRLTFVPIAGHTS